MFGELFHANLYYGLLATRRVGSNVERLESGDELVCRDSSLTKDRPECTPCHLFVKWHDAPC